MGVPRRNPMGYRLRLALVMVLLFAACAGTPDVIEGVATERLVRVDTIELSSDSRSVTLGFTGSAPLVESDPCTESYEGTARVVDETLEVALAVDVATLEHGEVTPDLACEAMGYLRQLTVEMPEPFTGHVVKDLAGFTRFLEAPSGLVVLAGLPDGWEIVFEGDLPESPTGRWSRTYSSVAVPTPSDPQVELIQAFDGPAEVSGGEEQRSIIVGNVEGLLYRHGPTGELVLVWQPGPDGLALVLNERDFTAEEMVDLAESIETSTG